jgi:hypothetical protein
MKQYRHIEALIRFYFHELDTKQQLGQALLTQTRERIRDLTRLLEQTLPSLGVSLCDGAETRQAGRHSDTTAALALSQHPEIRALQRELAAQHRWELRLTGEQREFAQVRLTIERALDDLKRIHAKSHAIIVARYRDGASVTSLAEAHYCNPSTITRDVEQTFRQWDDYFSHYLPAQAMQMTAEILPKFRKRVAENAGGVLV